MSTQIIQDVVSFVEEELGHTAPYVTPMLVGSGAGFVVGAAAAIAFPPFALLSVFFVGAGTAGGGLFVMFF